MELPPISSQDVARANIEGFFCKGIVLKASNGDPPLGGDLGVKTASRAFTLL